MGFWKKEYGIQFSSKVMNAIKSITVMWLTMVLVGGCCSSPAPKKKPLSEKMTKWGPPLSEEEKARIAKLSTIELVNLLQTGTTLQKFAALRGLKANGRWKKNFDLLLSIAGDRGAPGDMIVEGLVSAVDESASAEDRRRVDKFVDLLESELKRDKPAISHSQAVRSLGQAVHSPLRLPGGIRPGRERPPYGYQRIMGILTSCLDNTDWNVREVAFRWLGTLGEQDPAMNKKIIAILEAQMAKEEAREEEERVKENLRKVMEDTLRKLRSRLREPATPGGLVRPPDGI